MVIDWVLVLCIALGALGLIQYLKNWIKSAPSWLWAAVLPVVILGLAVAFTYLPSFVVLAFLALCVTQLGWDVLFQLLLNLVRRLTGASASDSGGGG